MTTANGDMARAVFERVGKSAPVQVVGGLNIAQAKNLARAGLRAFVISGNMGVADTVSRYDRPAAEIQRYVDLGFDRVYLHNVGRNQREWIEVFGRDVLPKLTR